MPKVDVFNLKREKVGELELSDDVFGAEIKEQLFYEVVKAQLASRRAGTAAAKERAAVSGSTKGGGQAHPPKPRDWSYRPPRQMRIGALKSALSLFVKEGRLIVLDKIELAEIKTKALASVLDALQIARKALVVDDKANENLKLSIRNMQDHQYLPPEGVNVYDLLRHDHLVVSRDAAKALEARCLK